MAVGYAHVFPGFLTPVQKQLPFQNHRLLFTLASGERRKYGGDKVRLNRVSSSQPPGHESDMLTTETLRCAGNVERALKQGQSLVARPGSSTVSLSDSLPCSYGINTRMRQNFLPGNIPSDECGKSSR